MRSCSEFAAVRCNAHRRTAQLPLRTSTMLTSGTNASVLGLAKSSWLRSKQPRSASLAIPEGSRWSTEKPDECSCSASPMRSTIAYSEISLSS